MSNSVKCLACIGTGTIGAGWASLALARGLDVVAWDPAPASETALRAAVEAAWPVLERLGLSSGASPVRLRVAATLAEAVDGADYIQESAPDDEPLKIDLVAEIDTACAPDAIIASSSSTFLPSRISSRCARPERVVVGHPFVPVYLVPLVEVVGGDEVSPAALERAMAFYGFLGKRPLRLAREVEGYIANRLQRALFREALSLVADGVCTFDDIEDAVTWGPGFRWATIGPVLHRHLGGGPGGVRHMLEHFGWPGAPGQDEVFVESIEARWGGYTMRELEAWRDDNLLAMLEHLRDLPARGGAE